jgi:hypothetical protein
LAHPLTSTRSLARRPAVRAGAAILLVAGAAAGSLPLLETPGWELGEAAALLAALLAPAVGIAAARAELGREAPSPLAAWAAAALVLGGLVGAAVLGALARAALGPCAVSGPALGYVPLLAVPTVLLGAALAVAVTFVAGGRRALAVALYVLAAAISLAASLARAWRGPAAFVVDPLLGLWPGPIYDEVVVPDLRALLARGGAAAEAVAVAAAAETFVRAGRAGLRAAAGPAAALLVAGAGAASCGLALEALGLSGSRAALTRALGGRREGARCALVFPAELPAPAVDAFLADCEFQVEDLSRILGIPPPRVTVWVYRSAEEKRRLVGAAATDYAKPWLGEVHVVDGPIPHPLLRHELVHAVGAAIADGPLGVPARHGVLVSAGLVEGLAGALETPRGRWTVHEWARAAKELGLLPDVAALVGPVGFWSQPPARAYTAVGSFLAFVLERHGAARLREAYRTGDVAAATGIPLPELAEEWSRFLDGIEPPPGLLTSAKVRLRRGSLFARRCAREVAGLEARAGAAAAAGRTADACALYAAASDRSGDAGALKLAGDLRARAGDLARAGELYRAAERRAGDGDGAVRATIAAAQGDLAWRADEVAAAAASWSAALGTHPERAETRLLEAKLVAAADPSLGPAARPFLLGVGDPTLALARVARADHPLAAYLVGRALATRGEDAAAVPELARAAAGQLPPTLAREAALLLGGARCAAGAAAAGIATLRPLAAPDASGADRARAEEALRRCAWRPAGR